MVLTTAAEVQQHMFAVIRWMSDTLPLTTVDTQHTALAQLLELCRTLGTRLGMDIQSKMHEIIYAQKHELRVCTDLHGVDMRDKRTAVAVEHKHMKVVIGATCNVNIKLPTWPVNTDRTVYARMAHADVLTKGDVHVEADVVNDTTRSYVVVLPVAFVALYVQKYIEQARSGKRLPHVPFGGRVCRTCMRVHRLDQFVRDAVHAAQLTDAQWGELFTRRVGGQCA